MLGPGCGKDQPVSPVETVTLFHNHAEKQEWEAAHKLIDLHVKCQRMLGEVYLQGPPEAQAEMREIWKRKLVVSTEKYLDKHFGDSLGTVTQTEGDATNAVVQQQKGKFRLIYTLELREGKWLIVDRTHELDGVRPDPGRGMGVVLGRIEAELGRKPTLAELNARLEDYMSRLRIRQIKVQH